MHKYRTHNCSQLTLKDVGQKVKLSGWVHRKRDHGGVFFIDLRDHYGITQIVAAPAPEAGQEKRAHILNAEDFDKIVHMPYESVICVIGTVVARSAETVNKDMQTGEIELVVEEFEVLSKAETLPFPVNSDQQLPDQLRLTYRFLDLRREKLHSNIMLRHKIISYIRKSMIEQGFSEFQTPILTASSPEGARDFLVPSRVHPGKFYALPQAPQQFKQLLMISGFDRYFQIAPCFRDEDARADRAPGEFYQLDVEMSYVTQEDVFQAIEPVILGVFREHSNFHVDDGAIPRIKYDDAMLKYGCDKPDLRNPIEICDVTEIFHESGFSIFSKAVASGATIRAIPAPKTHDKSRSFFDKMIGYAQGELEAKGLAYIIFDENGEAKGPIAKLLDADRLNKIKHAANLNNGDSVFFACDNKTKAEKQSAGVRNKLGHELGLIKEDVFKFCWIIDYPYFEWNDDENKLDFSHNPFSMPQGGLHALEEATGNKDKLLSLKAYQYDIVCNGVELSSGAIRNHDPEIMYKAFSLVGYDRNTVDEKFGGMIKAFRYGAPPHGGIAPGIDRMVMLIANEPNIREVICFPLNQNAKDLLMNAPCEVDLRQLRELNIMLSPKAREELEKSKSNES